ncbi:hypothetical protein L6164_016256 [Bauhinia variegata]|uniref:Uncharacterized protein n=1 Tax=Bauhinia variegata TaxID=167791 RepID=A0ACB9NNZ3_BAUVA|nr:hypothetical protein L6164_016256 [Bauhinia variegata]
MLDPRTHQPSNSFQLSNGVGERNQGSESFWAPKPAQNYRGVQFRTERKDTDDSGICSPPLWRTSPPRSPQHRKNYYRSLSRSQEPKPSRVAKGSLWR